MAKRGASTVVPRLRFPEFRGTKGWEEIKLGAIATILKGKGIAKSDVVADGAQPCIRYGELYTRYGEVIDTVYSRTNASLSELFMSRRNDVIIPASGETKLDIAKASCVIHDGVALGGDLNVLRTDQNGVFLSYFLNGSKRFEVAKVAQGDTVVHLYPSQLQEIFVAAPEPAEQQKIADCLTSLDEVIAAQGRKVEALKAHKRGLMQQLFPRESETRPRLRFPEFRNAPEWGARRFFDLFEDVLDFRGRTPKKLGMDWGGGDIISLSANNVKNGFIDYDAECYLGSEELYSRWMAGTNLEMGDIVFTMEAPLGKALLVPDRRKYILSQRVVAFKTKPDVINEFLIQLIWSDAFQRALGLLATGSTAKGVSQKSLQGLLVSLPEEDEQRMIAQCLAPIDTQIASETSQLTALKTHKQGLMKRLFPAPETASA